MSSKRPERTDNTASNRSAPKQTTEMEEIAGQSAPWRDLLRLRIPIMESAAPNPHTSRPPPHAHQLPSQTSTPFAIHHQSNPQCTPNPPSEPKPRTSTPPMRLRNLPIDSHIAKKQTQKRISQTPAPTLPQNDPHRFRPKPTGERDPEK
ncbi:hypothetical protein KC19_1G052500 [Ceratodon purpureus]|uniref:Uncharacterized protein n=1 Tax=Ceratodon purpureus TaxID=3225 RepID=A0A8T0H7Z1_CERPU|nr:hypothetical protein KC19_8G172800 [Ceratodon purpureus]KAG0589838.1 hypothetical protein KC19_1G052500 [Ceratodon purpureus]